MPDVSILRVSASNCKRLPVTASVLLLLFSKNLVSVLAGFLHSCVSFAGVYQPDHLSANNGYFSNYSFLDNKNNSEDKFMNLSRLYRDCRWVAQSPPSPGEDTKTTQKLHHSCVCVSLLLKNTTQLQFVQHKDPQRTTTGRGLSLKRFPSFDVPLSMHPSLLTASQSLLASGHMTSYFSLFHPTM